MLGVAYGSCHPKVEVLVDGRPVRTDSPLTDTFRAAGEDGSPPEGFRVTLDLGTVLPTDARAVRVRGTIPFVVGVGPRTQTVACDADLRNIRVDVGGLQLGPGSRSVVDGQSEVFISASGPEHAVQRIEFLDAAGHVIRSEDRGVVGGSISGNLFGSWWFVMRDDTPIASMRVSSWNSVEAWDAPIDVEGPVTK